MFERKRVAINRPVYILMCIRVEVALVFHDE